MSEYIYTIVEAALKAGQAIMEIYEKEDFQIETKADDSPLTLADKKANDVINGALEPLGIPIISEENKQISFAQRKDWERCWIVDPLDGTKEFIKRNGEFTVNIALVSGGRPELGVIFAPALGLLYFADVASGKACKTKLEDVSSAIDHNRLAELVSQAEQLKPSSGEAGPKVVGSRSHMNDATREFIQGLQERLEREVEIVSVGSSLKFCLVAEGSADYYPRYAPTMEWDTAAGQAICEAVGLQVIARDTGEPMRYNRENLLNEHFLVSNEGHFV